MSFLHLLFLNNESIIDTTSHLTSDNFFYVYLIAAVVSLLGIGIIIVWWNRKGKHK